MKKEKKLDVLSSVIVIGAILFELFNQIKETGEFSIRALLNIQAPVTVVTYACDERGENGS